MPDRYGDEPAELASRQEADRVEREAKQRLARAAAQARYDGIRHCGLCDDDGYVGGMVCDHVDHAETARRGMAMIRATMGWDR